ncbi:MAG: hypothetical protein H5T34_04245 [Candidatus Methanomethyliales bacterium]|nr:hypothetical protein [Candidatus Methanomethylicales archaeon]
MMLGRRTSEWDDFANGRLDLPLCWGRTPCTPEALALCPWVDGCKEAGLR